MPKTVERLFEQFQPSSYDLLMNVDAAGLTFKGTVIVRGKKVGRPSQRFTFHQKSLKITAASILKHGKDGSKSLPISRINNQDSADEVRLHSDGMIYPGDYTVTMEFAGEITRQMHGIYPCFFKDGDEEKRLIATQFESHHAREAFPCIDEPEAKATFDLKLVTPQGQTVLANTPVKQREEIDDRQVTTFETSPVMSTYLLAFVFGEMHGVAAETKDGIKVTSWSTVAQPVDHLKYANDEAVSILEFFTDYFQTPFPLKKLDQVALPDFDSLAMENWGLITFREVGLLADPVNRSLSAEQLITLVVAHELSHQWFGNLVTMKWWDDLWLNESFASIMENIAPDKLHPDWNQWEDFATSRVLSCSHRDIYKDVQPVGVSVKHPDEISTLFDPAIVYAKGARLLTMLYEYLGEDTFREGLRDYFKKHAYKNTTRQDLWDSFASVSQQDIKALMTPWIEQSGQPKLSVTKEDGMLHFSQKRFLLDGDDEKSLWPIPFLSDVKLSPDLLEKREADVKYASKETPIFNVNGSGHYIVDYTDEASKESVRSILEDRSLPSIGRITVLNDMLLLARAGEYALSSMLDMISKSTDEPRDAVWSMFVRVIGQSQTLTDGDKDIEPEVRRYKHALAKHWYDKLGWDDKDEDEPNTKHLRTTALALSIAGENKDAIKHSLALLDEAGSVTGLTAERRGMIATVAVRHGKPEHISQFMDEYTSSPNPDVQSAITSALCSTRDRDVAKSIIEWGLKEGGVIRQQDIDHWFAYLMRNHYTRELAWDWFVNSWDYLAELFSGGKHMEYFVWYSAGPVSTREWQKRFKEFFEPKMEEPALKRNILIALSEIEARVEWREREENDLKNYYKNYKAS